MKYKHVFICSLYALLNWRLVRKMSRRLTLLSSFVSFLIWQCFFFLLGFISFEVLQHPSPQFFLTISIVIWAVRFQPFCRWGYCSRRRLVAKQHQNLVSWQPGPLFIPLIKHWSGHFHWPKLPAWVSALSVSSPSERTINIDHCWKESPKKK